jgi:FkbM family methyltransferase
MNNFVNLICQINEKWIWRKDDNDFGTFKVLSQETDLLEKVKPFLKGNKVIVQAGGNCGMQVEKFAHFFETVYTFEPDPINFHCLVNNLMFTNVVKFQCCLGNEHKMVSMVTVPNQIGGFYVDPSKGTIPTLRIDDLNLENCDFIQLDVEGYQLFALMGGIDTIKKFKPVICVEHDWTSRYNVDETELVSFLANLGYCKVDRYTSDYIYVYQSLNSNL